MPSQTGTDGGGLVTPPSKSERVAGEMDAWDEERAKDQPEVAAFVHQWLRARAKAIRLGAEG